MTHSSPNISPSAPFADSPAASPASLSVPRITALLLDRDGTVIEDVHYLAHPSQVRLLPGVGEALSRLSRKGLRFFLVSNQSGVGRGMFSLDAVHAANARLAELLLPYGVVFTDAVFCPHAPEAGCACRKPGTGMWDVLRDRHGLTAQSALMVGDKSEDMRFAANAGLAGQALVLSGKGRDAAGTFGICPAGLPFFQLTGRPEQAGYPHLTLSAFSQLETGLELLERAWATACNA